MPRAESKHCGGESSLSVPLNVRLTDNSTLHRLLDSPNYTLHVPRAAITTAQTYIRLVTDYIEKAFTFTFNPKPFDRQ